MPLEVLSHSQIACWNRCRFQWHLQYERGIEPRYDRPSLNLGSAVHVGLAAGLLGQSIEAAIHEWQDSKIKHGLTQEEDANLDDICNKAFALVERTLKNLDIGHKWQTYVWDGQPLVEFHFEIPMRINTVRKFHGYVDWVATELETGRTWLLDHKVYESFQPETSEEVNVQMAIYQYMLKLKGIPAVGSICHQIKPRIPAMPKVNKDGSLSRSAITTDWETYERALMLQGLDPLEYQDMKEKLADVEFFRMTRAYRSDLEIEKTWEETTVRAIRDVARKQKQIFRSLSPMNCNGCKVRELCLEELRGVDTEYLLHTKYKKRGEEATYTDIEIVEDM